MDIHESENQRKVSEFDCFISIFSINLKWFFYLNVFRHCSIEIKWNKENTHCFLKILLILLSVHCNSIYSVHSVFNVD